MWGVVRKKVYAAEHRALEVTDIGETAQMNS